MNEQISKYQLGELLQKICQMYSVKNDNLYDRRGQDKEITHKKKRPSRYPTRLECGQKIFSKQPANQVVDIFIAALEHIPQFKKEFSIADRQSEFIFKNGTDIEHVLTQSFFLWFEFYEKCRHKQKALNKNRTEGSKGTSSSDSLKKDDFRPTSRTPTPPPRGLHRVSSIPLNKKQGTEQMVDTRKEMISLGEPSMSFSALAISDEKLPPKVSSEVNDMQRIIVNPTQCNKILDLIIPIDFTGKGPYIWKTIISVLELKNQNNIGNFICRIMNALRTGRVSFTVLQYYLSQPNLFMRMSDPKMLVTALLLGPLNSNTVEQFVSNRSNDFRSEVKKFLLLAETWKTSKFEFEKAVIEFAYKNPDEVPSFEQFCANVTNLISDLKNEVNDRENLVSYEWARSLITTAARKFYQERTWSKDQFNDLLHTLLVQRPTLKSFLLNVLLKDHKDRDAFERWRNFISTDRFHMSKNFEKIDLYSHNEVPDFLSLPKRCEVFVIGNIQQFRIFEKQFTVYESKRTGHFVVGIDAEWNSYVMKSRASILQVSLSHSVYLLDLDALHLHEIFANFIDHIFMNEKIIKLGYKFTDDLVQLRLRLPHCIGLYRPNKLYCIGRIVDELYRRSKYLADFPMDKFILPINDREEEKMRMNARQFKPHYPGRGNANSDSQVQQFAEDGESIDEDVSSKQSDCANGQTRIVKYAEQGLSYLCRRVLGKPLNKQEQCSVWDRRPLRSSQVKYAALDAHCLVQIYRRCCEWATQLKLEIGPHELMPAYYMCSSVPLFWDKPLPPPVERQQEVEAAECDADEELPNGGW